MYSGVMSLYWFIVTLFFQQMAETNQMCLLTVKGYAASTQWQFVMKAFSVVCKKQIGRESFCATRPIWPLISNLHIIFHYKYFHLLVIEMYYCAAVLS